MRLLIMVVWGAVSTKPDFESHLNVHAWTMYLLVLTPVYRKLKPYLAEL